MTLIDPRASVVLGLNARLDGGRAVSLSETEWDVSGRCERPQRVTVEGRQYRTHTFDPHWGWVRPAGYDLAGNLKWTGVENMTRAHATHLEVRCGKCRACLAARRYQWTERAKTECARPETRRTWFATLTASPETQLRWSSEAAQRLRAGGTDPTSLGENEWYKERCKEAGRELTKFMKRVRKQSRVTMRALWVFERHEGGGLHDGLPHLHGLIHEVDGAVKYRLLRAEWMHGFSTFKVLTTGSESDSDSVAAYVSKCCGYLAKATHVRIRASRHYGDPNYPVIRSRAERIAFDPEGDESVERGRFPGGKTAEGTQPQSDAGGDLRARGTRSGPGECKAPAVDGSAEGRGENPFPLLRVAHRDRREPEARQGRQERGADLYQTPEGTDTGATAYRVASRGG